MNPGGPYEIRLVKYRSHAHDLQDDVVASRVVPLELNEDDAAQELERLGLNSDKPIEIEILIAYAIVPYVRKIHVDGFEGSSWIGVWTYPDIAGKSYQKNVIDNNKNERRIRGIAFRASIPRRAMQIADLIVKADSSAEERDTLVGFISYFCNRPMADK